MKRITPRIVQATYQSSTLPTSVSRLWTILTHVNDSGSCYQGYARDGLKKPLTIHVVRSAGCDLYIACDLDTSSSHATSTLREELDASMRETDNLRTGICDALGMAPVAGPLPDDVRIVAAVAKLRQERDRYAANTDHWRRAYEVLTKDGTPTEIPTSTPYRTPRSLPFASKRLPTITELEALDADRGPSAVLLRNIIDIIWSDPGTQWDQETTRKIAQVLATAGLSPDDWPERETPTTWLHRTLRQTTDSEQLRSIASAMAGRLDDESVRDLFADEIDRGI